jgi:hypothetical protein
VHDADEAGAHHRGLDVPDVPHAADLPQRSRLYRQL